MDVDLLVIGWGKAGKTLAGRYAAAGHSVALVERSPKMYGGTCINIACVPTKDLVVSAEQRRESDDPAEYFAQSVAGRDALIEKLNKANHAMLEKPNVTLIDGTARFVGPHEVSIDTADGEVSVTASKIIVGTGATPARLPIPGADGDRIYDSTTIQHVEPFPKRLVVIDGGFVGLEFANMFAHFGSEVTVLNGGDTFLPAVDRDVAEAVLDAFKAGGIRVESGVKVEEFSETADAVVARSSAGEFEADAVLVAAGRAPATKELGLDAVGITTNERGFIEVDDQLQTSVEGVYAVGDVNGGPQFTYISLDDNRIVWDAIVGDGTRRRSDRVAVPNSTFITPPLSMVGMNEKQVRESGRKVLVASKPVEKIAAMPRPKIVGDTRGLFKIFVDDDTEEILGATVFSIDSQELINFVSLAMRLGAKVSDLRDGIWTHPSSTEGFNEVLGELKPLD